MSIGTPAWLLWAGAGVTGAGGLFYWSSIYVAAHPHDDMRVALAASALLAAALGLGLTTARPSAARVVLAAELAYLVYLIAGPGEWPLSEAARRALGAVALTAAITAALLEAALWLGHRARGR